MEFDFNFHVSKGWFYYGHFYAYGLGKDGFSGSTFIPYDSCLSFHSHNGIQSEYTQTSRDVFFDDGKKPDKVWAVPHGAHNADHKGDDHSTGEAH